MWVRLDDSIVLHPKFVRSGPEAFGLFVAGLCYCNKFETDGRIPKVALAHLLPGVSGRRAMRLAERLASNDPQPSWVDEGEHYRVHDYELYQIARDEGRQQRQRELAAERKRRQRARERGQSLTAAGDDHAGDREDGESVTGDSSVSVTGDGHGAVRDSHAAVTRDGHGRVTRDRHAPLPGPLPPRRPVLCKREFSMAHARGAHTPDGHRDLGGEFRIWFGAYPRQEGEVPALRAWLAAGDLPPLPELLAALEAQKGANAEPRYWRKPERYLRELGWRDQAVPPPAVPGRAGRTAKNDGARGGEGGAWEDR
jgi:hypothetical protein